jgi:hypothetical protein
MTPEQALSQIEIAYAALAELQKVDWLSSVHHKIPVDIADAIHHTNEVWARLENSIPALQDKNSEQLHSQIFH